MTATATHDPSVAGPGRPAAAGVFRSDHNGPMRELNEVDVGIITALQDDARLPFTSLASRLGISEARVRRRVRALLDADAIAITAVADPRVFGLDSMAWLGLTVEPSRVEAVAEGLLGLRGIDYVVITGGELNVMAEAACSSSDELYELLLAVRSLPGVGRTETFLYLRLLRQNFEWSRARAAPSPIELIRARPPALDQLDIALIQALQRNGRAPFREIAKQLDVSERVVSARYARLVSEQIVQVSAVVNPTSLGFRAMAWLGVRLAHAADFEQVASSLAAVPEISYLVVSSGRYDLMAEIVCRTTDDLIATLARDVGGIEGIGTVDVFHYFRLLYPTTAGAWSAARSLVPPAGQRSSA